MISEEKSGVAQVTYESLNFILNNPDILTTLCKTPLKLSLYEHDKFKGKITHLKLELEIFEDEEDTLHEVEYVLSVEMPLTIGRCQARATLAITPLKDDATILEYQFKMRPSRLAMSVLLFKYRKVHTYFHDNIIKFIEQSAGYIDNNSDVLREKLSTEQLGRTKQFIDKRTTTSATVKKTVAIESEEEGDLVDNRIWSAELLELTKIHSVVQGEASELKIELDRLQQQQDAVATLLYARRMLEIVVGQLCESILNRERGKEPLSKLIDKLGKKKKKLPENIWSSMKNLNSIATFGAHPKDFSDRQVREALMALCTVLEWHLKKVVVYPKLATDEVA